MVASSSIHDRVTSLPCSRASDERQLDALGKSSTAIEPQVSAEDYLIPLLLYRPTNLAKLLNSTALGEVTTERRLHGHRVRAGGRICKGRHVDLWSYVAWLIFERRAKRDRVTRRAIDSVARGNVTAKGVMRLLERQKFRCALTGRPLNPNSVALDHIHPVSRGGQHRIENAQVLEKDVNRAKGTLTNKEFIQLCREVAAHADRNSPELCQQGEVA